jgi:uncharacterized membrane protein YgdD (TMEM256/DUF423 family)
MFRTWLFVSGLSGALAILAAAAGAHLLNEPANLAVVKVYETGQLYHALHSVALLGIALLVAATEGRRRAWGGCLIHAAGIAFIAGILFFSGGIYHHILTGLAGPSRIVPVGGMAFIIGWAALALSAFGLRRATPGAN